MIAIHSIQYISFENDFLCLKVDGEDLKIALDVVSMRLKAASDLQRNVFSISPSGYGIHWPLIDEDLSIKGILKLLGRE